MLAGWAGQCAQNTRRNGRLRDLITEHQLAARIDKRLTLKIGKLTVAQRTFEVKVNLPILRAHIARSVQRLDAGTFSGCSFKAKSVSALAAVAIHKTKNSAVEFRICIRSQMVPEA